MNIFYPFEKKHSPIFGDVYRPVVPVHFWSKSLKDWIEIILLVDSGADYTILPVTYAYTLGIQLKDTRKISTSGVGGVATVHFLSQFPIRVGTWRHRIPVGFLAASGIPPLLGRQHCLEVMKVVLHQHRTSLVV